MSPILNTSDDEGCIEACTTGVPDSAQQVSPILHTEQSTLTVPSNRLSLRAPAGAKAEREKGASGGVRKTGSSRRPSSKSAGSPWPADFYLTEEREMEFERAGLKIATMPETFAAFRDHARDANRRSADWDAAWRNWCRRAAERQKAAEAKAGAGKPKPSRYAMPRSMMV